MNELKNIFTPEINPFHKVEFSISSVVTFTDDEITALLAGKDTVVVPAGTGIACTVDSTKIAHNPTAKTTIKRAGNKTASGLTASDLVIKAGVNDYNIGVAVRGVVYSELVDQTLTVAEKTALQAQGITFYNVKIKKK